MRASKRLREFFLVSLPAVESVRELCSVPRSSAPGPSNLSTSQRISYVNSIILSGALTIGRRWNCRTSSTSTTSGTLDEKSTNGMEIFAAGKRMPRGFWSRVENERAYLDWLGDRLGYKSRGDWYRVKLSDFQENGGSFIVNNYGGSPYAILSKVYTDFTYIPWLFKSVPSNFFTSVDNRRKYVDWLVAKLGLSGVHELKQQHFLENGGQGLIKSFKGSPNLILKSLSDDSASQRPYMTKIAPQNFWDSRENQRQFLEGLAEELKLPKGDLSAWYRVKKSDVVSNGGNGLLKKYNSLSKALLKLYPEYEWMPWKFTRAPERSLSDPEVIKKAIEFAEKELGIQSFDAWKSIGSDQLDNIGLLKLFKCNGGIKKTLEKVFPGRTAALEV